MPLFQHNEYKYFCFNATHNSKQDINNTLPIGALPYCIYTKPNDQQFIYCVPVSHPWIYVKLHSSVITQPKTYGYAAPTSTGIHDRGCLESFKSQLKQEITNTQEPTDAFKKYAKQQIKDDIEKDPNTQTVLKHNENLKRVLNAAYKIYPSNQQETSPLIESNDNRNSSSCCVII